MPILLGCGLGAAVLAPVIPSGGRRALVDRGCRSCLDRVLGAPGRVAAARPDVVAARVVALGGGDRWRPSALRLLPPYRRRAAVVAAVALVPLACARLVGAAPASDVVAAGRAARLVPRRRPGRRDPARDARRERCWSTPARPRRTSTGSCGAWGCTALAALVITHAHRDHVGGAPAVLRHARGRAGDRPAAARRRRPTSATMRRDGAPSCGVPLVAARAGRRYALGRLRLRVLWPDRAGSPDEDPHLHGAVAARELRRDRPAPDRRLRVGGDARRSRCARVEVLKVAHHGSSDPGLADELRVLRPRVAVISVGAHNDYGHPRADTLAALDAAARARGLPHRRERPDRARVGRPLADGPDGASSTVGA